MITQTDLFLLSSYLAVCLCYYYNYSYQKVVQGQQSYQMSGGMDPCCMISPGLSTKLGRGKINVNHWGGKETTKSHSYWSGGMNIMWLTCWYQKYTHRLNSCSWTSAY